MGRSEEKTELRALVDVAVAHSGPAIKSRSNACWSLDSRRGSFAPRSIVNAENVVPGAKLACGAMCSRFDLSETNHAQIHEEKTARSLSESQPVRYRAVCNSMCAQRELPLSGYGRHQREAFSLDDQMQWERSPISSAQRRIAGRIPGDLEWPARLLNLYPQCLIC